MDKRHYHLEPQFDTVTQGREAFRKSILASKFPPSSAPDVDINTWDVLIYLDSLTTGELDETHARILYSAVEKLVKYEKTFNMSIILRVLFQFPDRIKSDLTEACKQMILNWSFWPDEIIKNQNYGRDMSTENHYMLYASNGLLAAQLFKEEEFTVTYKKKKKTKTIKQKGKERLAPYTGRLEKWLDLRYQTGFSEYLSNGYYAVDVMGLVNVYDFIEDERIKQKTAMVLDVLFMDMAMNHWYGGLGTTTGRVYFDSKRTFHNHRTLTIFYQWLGYGSESNALDRNRGGVFFNLTNYTPPNVLRNIALQMSEASEIQQKQSWHVEDAKKYGINPKSLEDGLHLLTLDAQTHPRVIKLFIKMMSAFDWWNNGVYKDLKGAKGLLQLLKGIRLVGMVARIMIKDLTRYYRPTVNTYNYRTAAYSLSTTQDYRKGYGGFQQQSWQANLGPSALVFTTNPAKLKKASPPDLWTGGGVLPRCAQHKNVCVAYYKIEKWPALIVKKKIEMTHAWFPKAEFDKVFEKDHWLFGKKGNGYLALWSQQPYQWQQEGDYKDQEVIAAGKENTWICELGDQESWGSFDDFVAAISNAKVAKRGDSVEYLSPSIGKVVFGWNGDFEVKGQRVDLHPPYRYDNPWIRVLDLTKGFKLALGGSELVHDWKTLKREVVE
ncbi:MAG: hypothetical protein R8G66_02530 [Cytophagales bacterium]|nr:hypothetical protein [Cytophagales bacterium]